MCPSTEGDIFVMTEGEKEGEKRECLQIAMQQTREKNKRCNANKTMLIKTNADRESVENPDIK